MEGIYVIERGSQYEECGNTDWNFSSVAVCPDVTTVRKWLEARGKIAIWSNKSNPDEPGTEYYWATVVVDFARLSEELSFDVSQLQEDELRCLLDEKNVTDNCPWIYSEQPPLIEQFAIRRFEVWTAA